MCGSISHAHHSPRAPLGQSERGHRSPSSKVALTDCRRAQPPTSRRPPAPPSPPRSSRTRVSCEISEFGAPSTQLLNRGAPRPSRARASRQRRWSTLPISADRSVPRVQTPIQGTKKPKHSPQAIIRQRHRCRRLASSVVLIVRRHQLRAAPIVGAVTIVRSSPTNHRRRPPCGGPPAAPQSAAQAADAGRAACRSISHAHRCPRAPLGQSGRDHRRSPQRSCLNLLPSRATPYLAPAAGTIITASPLARTREGAARKVDADSCTS